MLSRPHATPDHNTSVPATAVPRTHSRQQAKRMRIDVTRGSEISRSAIPSSPGPNHGGAKAMPRGSTPYTVPRRQPVVSPPRQWAERPRRARCAACCWSVPAALATAQHPGVSPL